MTMAGRWCDTTWLQTRYNIRLCGGCLLEYNGGTASRATKLLNISTTCLKTPASFLTFLTEIGIVNELRLCFKDDSFFSQTYGNITVVYPQVSNHFQFSWCLPHKKKDHDYLWEVHGFNFSTLLHFMSHTYYVVCNASKWGYILFSLLGWNFFLEFATFWTTADYHCSEGVHFTAV